MNRKRLLIAMAGMSISGCCAINDTFDALENNRQAVEMSTAAICENIQAIEDANRTIEENRRQLEAINKALKSAGS